MNPIAEAEKLIKPATRIAAALGVSSAAISKYKRLGRIPSAWALPLHELTGGVVSKHDTAPEYYPREVS